MLNVLFHGIFDTDYTAVIGVGKFLLCVISALVCGLLFAGANAYRNRFTKGFLITIALLPAAVCVVIMMVNGNIGAGVAVAGAFALVRFRSAPGTAKEIIAIFLAMASGLILGMGYIAFAFLFTIILAAVSMLYTLVSDHIPDPPQLDKTLRVVIPEDLNYSDIFDDIFDEYTTAHQLNSVKTTNMGSLFRLTYDVTLTDESKEKEMIDKIRCRNGNLEITIARKETETTSEL